MTEDSKKLNFSSKYLSPCRVIGLKRKATSPLFPVPDLKSKSSPTNNFIEKINNPISNTCEDDKGHHYLSGENNSSSVSDNLMKTPRRIRGSKKLSARNPADSNDFEAIVSNTSKINEENDCCTSSEIQLKSHSKNDTEHCVTPNLTTNSNSRITLKQELNVNNQLDSLKLPSNVLNSIVRINEKCVTLENLQKKPVLKKRDMGQLEESSVNWKAVCIRALERLHYELRSRGQSDTCIFDLIQAHSIPPELISFDTENQDFN